MYIIALLLFLAGMWVTGLAFALPAWQGVVFVCGILMVGLAIALPIHVKAR